MWSGFCYCCCCSFDGRRCGGAEDVSQSSFGGGFFFISCGFPVSVVSGGSRLGMGLESFPNFSDMGCVVCGRYLVLLHGREAHSDSYICRRMGIGDGFFIFFLCVDAQSFCAFLWVGCDLPVDGEANFMTYNMAGVRRSVGSFTGDVFIGILYLQGIFFVRLILHKLLVGGWCSRFPCAGLLFVGRSLLVMRPASVSGVRDCPGRSAIQQHNVLLMGSKFEDSSSNREAAGSLILDLLHCWRWRRTTLRQQWLATATSTGCSLGGLKCNFIFFQGYPVRGLDVILLYQ
ncbi:unnamed protein product [Urochloa humidicola]